MPPLPLLRLPQLILREVFKSLSIIEKIKLSLCSKKMSRINISRLHSQKVIVVLDILKQSIRVLSENNKDIFEIFTYPDSGIGQNSNISRGVQMFSKNHQEGFLSVTRNLLKMFRCKVTTNISCYNGDLYQPMVSMLLNLQVEFKKLTISLKRSEDELLLNHISNKPGLVEDLRILLSWLPGFRPVFTSWPKKITIMNSAWFTLEHLLACPCTTIRLCQSYLRNKDLNEILGWCISTNQLYFSLCEQLAFKKFHDENCPKKERNLCTSLILRKWKAGGFQNLEYLRVDKYSIKNSKTRSNLLALRGIVIQSDDRRKKATIDTRCERIEISVTPF
ncbi:hypothetical protein CRE_22043 [Caenorhabditis remanei]|uniref:F-box domain-containing protein n=1 Tax=Caenorhabditis remanei TaxID=31234 RepID=E3N3I8_CAERE|nr:hypothetical protein CRE_22043 [Caenorhabditis remanei]